MALKSVKLPWQFAQSPVLGCLLSATKNCPAVLCGLVWKPLNGALVVIGYCVMLIHTALVSWQLEQLPLTPVWIIAAVGAGFRKPLPGAVLVATAGTNVLGVEPR